jgi:putative tricarboxylic transport membrane protein
MGFWSNLALGIQVGFTTQNLLYCFLGVTLGNLIGVIPGVGAVAAVSILLPVTYHIPPSAGLIMLAGLYYGAVYGAVTGAILLNIPHTVSAVECLDGYPMAKQGRAGVALLMTTIASLCGSVVGIVIVALFAPPVAAIALTFESPDYLALVVLGMTGAIALARGSPIRSFIIFLTGMLIGLVGVDVTSAQPRFTFGLSEFLDGIPIGVIAMGLFGVAELIINAGQVHPGAVNAKDITWRSLLPTRDDIKRSWPAILRGTGIGSFFGVLPGGGSVLASIIAYTMEKQVAAEPDRFGKGAIEGVVAPEAAANSACQTSFVPMLTLGIPTDPITAVMLAALLVKGISPGPDLISAHPDIFWGLVVSFVVGNALLVIWHIPFIRLWVRLLTVPFDILFPSVLVLICLGVYTIHNSITDIVLVLIFGCIGYGMRLLRFEPAPLLIGLVLGPLMESYLRRSLIVSHGNVLALVARPISGGMLLLSAVILAWTFRKRIKAQPKQTNRVDGTIVGRC